MWTEFVDRLFLTKIPKPKLLDFKMTALWFLVLACLLLATVSASHVEKTSKGRTSSSLLSPVAVTVARTSSLLNSQGLSRVSFTTMIDERGNWDSFNNELTVPSDSIYFFHLNAGAEAGNPVNMNLRGPHNNSDISRLSTSHTGAETIARDFINPVDAGSKIYITMEDRTSLFSNQGRQTSFTAFDLEYYMDDFTLAVFCAVQQNVYSTPGIMEYTRVLLDTDTQFFDKNKFVAPRDGIYFLSLSAGVSPSQGVRIQIQTSSSSQALGELWRAHTNHNSIDTISRSLMVSLVQGEYVFTNLMAGQSRSDLEFQTSFSGFLYDPQFGVPRAWSVYRTWILLDSPTDVDIEFEGTHVDTNRLSENGTITIDEAGLYYIQVNLGVVGGKSLRAGLYVGSNEVAQLTFSTTVTNDVDTVGQALLIQLFPGDVVKVVLKAGSSLWSDEDIQSSFTGFLLRS